jgi:hypothetical protein
MSRVTAPVSKLTRSISSTASISRPSHVLVGGSKLVANTGRKHVLDSEADSVDAVRTLTTASTSTIAHRPVASTLRTVPLMQGFRTSAPRPARTDPSHIDFAVLPALHAQAPVDEFAYMRVPLLPDNTQSGVLRAAEQPDAPLARPEILVIAANPEHVLPSALTEVEGMGIDGIELKFAHDLGREPAQEQNMLRDIWKGMVDDIFGPAQAAKPSLA